MERKAENLQFDSYLGGSQTVPVGLNLSDFIKHRMEEVVMLTEAIEESPFRGQTFQRLPKHMRRRQMSHYIKRLPRRLQRPYIMSLKEEPPSPTKRPSRKYRRRPSNLLLEYNRRQKKSIWLETHIWHAKRFHIISKWGYKLPEKPVNKSFKACYRAITEHCLLIDLSYFNCIELKGSRRELLVGLSQCTSPDCGLTFGAKMYILGAREGCLTLFHPNSYPFKVIGTVKFMWEPGNIDGKIWIWVHPQIHNEVVDCFKLVFNLSCANMEIDSEHPSSIEEVCSNFKEKYNCKTKKNNSEKIKFMPKNVPFMRTPKFTNEKESITMTILKDTLNRFHLAGPLSQAVISQAFTLASIEEEVEFLGTESKKRKAEVEIIENVDANTDQSNWWMKYSQMDFCRKNSFYEKMSELSRPTDVPSNVILGLVIEDPRLNIPSKRKKCVPKVTDLHQITDLSPKFSESPIWIPEVRDQVSFTKLSTHEINEARSKKIVPGFSVKDVISENLQSKIPVLIIQRPGVRDAESGKLGLGSGWDIIAPSGFGMPIWLSFVFRGARTGGLRELEHFHLELHNIKGFLPPDSASGEKENQEKFESLKTRYFKLPPNKRANFKKLGVISPFYPPWKVLIKDWMLRFKESLDVTDVKFYVLRSLQMLRKLNDIVMLIGRKNINTTELNNWDLNVLVPVVVECCGRGVAKHMAMICVPKDEDFKNKSGQSPKEPSHIDENEKRRKALKVDHRKLLKSLKRKRKKERSKLKEEFANDLPGKSTWKEIIKKNSFPSDTHSRDYNSEMERLWLPPLSSINTILGSCSRDILGFVSKGEFSFAKSHGVGLGYVTLPGLIEVLQACQRHKSKAVVLVRNRNQSQYRFANLRIVLE